MPSDKFPDLFPITVFKSRINSKLFLQCTTTNICWSTDDPCWCEKIKKETRQTINSNKNHILFIIFPASFVYICLGLYFILINHITLSGLYLFSLFAKRKDVVVVSYTSIHNQPHAINLSIASSHLCSMWPKISLC